MNFNFSQKPDYQLHTNLIDEMIKLYGTLVKFVVMDKIQDKGLHDSKVPENAIFNDFKALKTSNGANGSIEREIYVLLSDSEGYGNGLNFMFGQFGIVNEDTLQVFVSIDSLKFLSENGSNIHPKEIISNVLIFPNNKVMEITDCQLHVPGVNNKFVYSDNPSCYQLSLKSYNFDRSAVSNAILNKGTIGKIETSSIDSFFEKQDEMKELIEEHSTEEVLVTQCYKDKLVQGSKIDDVFGSF